MEKLSVLTVRKRAKMRNDSDDCDTTMHLLISDDDEDYARGKRIRASGSDLSCFPLRSEKWREKFQGGLRDKIYSKILILPFISKTSIHKNYQADMSRVPLMTPESSLQVADRRSMVMLEAGLPGDSWTYCVERERLARRSECFRAMLTGPLAPPLTDSPPLLQLQHVDKRAFDHFLRYLHDEPVNFISVSTARATLDAAHQYLCPGLANLAVAYLEKHLTPSTVLEIYQSLRLYANDPAERSGFDGSPNSPTAPSEPGDDASEIAAVCTRLLLKCLSVIDSNPVTVLREERFEELGAQEILELASRDTLNLPSESILFSALDRWAAAECRRQGVEPVPVNKRLVLSDDICFSVRYLLMNDREFVSGPMASGILTNEECVHIVSKILGHPDNSKNNNLRGSRGSTAVHPSRLCDRPRIRVCRIEEDEDCNALKPGKKERQDNRKNRRKECASQGQRTCARIGNCLVQILACVFD